MTLDVKTKNKNEKQTLNKVDDLILKRKGGGSIINQQPLFSGDWQTLYIVWKNIIRAYSVTTGDFVKELEPADHKIIGIALSPENSNTIIGCTDNAELVYWNCQNGLITMKTKCLVSDVKMKIKTFHIISYTSYTEKYMCCACISFIRNKGNEKTLAIELFDLRLGDKLLYKNIEISDEDYCIDIVANFGQNLIAIGHDIFLYIFNPREGLKYFRHKTMRKITCVSGHPEQECVAIGDISGRILVMRNILQINTIRATYHWHTLPVTVVNFSKSGGYMYSGGGECVLVEWLLTNPQHKAFLPRLEAPVRFVAIAPENRYIAISTLDNGIRIINHQRKLLARIQNFTWGVTSSPKNLFPAGLHIDPRTGSLVLNSRTGHIQFYNTHTKNLLYNLNITVQNYLTQERNTVLVNTEVTKLAINSNGMWLVTLEEWKDVHISHLEIRLKFWHFNTEKQEYALNTSIEYPHEFGVNALKFRPKSSFSEDNEYVLSVGKDNKFKLWHLADAELINKSTKHWRCHSVGFYRKLPALDAGFSTDGSLVGVSFDSILTLWDPETSELKTSLSYALYPEPITRIEFGKQEVCHLVVCASKEHIIVWDLLSLTVKWSVLINLTILTADPLSVYMAAFTTDNTLIVFTPGNPEIVYKRDNILEDEDSILGACFVPNLQHNEDVKWQSKSSLYFIDESQELLTLESKSESSIALENLSASRNLPPTIFNRIVPDKKVSNVEKQSYIHDYLRATNKGIEEVLLTTPAHTLPPMRMLCMPTLLSLMGKYKKKQSKEKSTRPAEKTNDDDSDSEKENLTDVPTVNPKEKTINSDNNVDDESNELLSFDWSFLANILPSNETVV